MAEVLIHTCDHPGCKRGAAGRIYLRARDRHGQKDLCERHLDAYFDGTDVPVRGTPRGLYPGTWRGKSGHPRNGDSAGEGSENDAA